MDRDVDSNIVAGNVFFERHGSYVLRKGRQHEEVAVFGKFSELGSDFKVALHTIHTNMYMYISLLQDSKSVVITTSGTIV